MATARLSGTECNVRITDDQNDNWSIEIAPVRKTPFPSSSFMPDPAVLVVKIHADSREIASRAALELLKKTRRIDDYTL